MSRHSKTVSVGQASSLFGGAPSNGGGSNAGSDDFFGGLGGQAGKANGASPFGAQGANVIAEEDDDEPAAATQKDHGAVAQAPAAASDEVDQLFGGASSAGESDWFSSNDQQAHDDPFAQSLQQPSYQHQQQQPAQPDLFGGQQQSASQASYDYSASEQYNYNGDTSQAYSQNYGGYSQAAYGQQQQQQGYAGQQEQGYGAQEQSYGQPEQQQSSYDGYGQSSYGQDTTYDATGGYTDSTQLSYNDSSYEEPPFYEGYIYDRASNSYLPDPNYVPAPAPSADDVDAYGNTLQTDSYGQRQQEQQPEPQQDYDQPASSSTGAYDDPYGSSSYGGASYDAAAPQTVSPPPRSSSAVSPPPTSSASIHDTLGASQSSVDDYLGASASSRPKSAGAGSMTAPPLSPSLQATFSPPLFRSVSPYGGDSPYDEPGMLQQQQRAPFASHADAVEGGEGEYDSSAFERGYKYPEEASYGQRDHDDDAAARARSPPASDRDHRRSWAQSEASTEPEGSDEIDHLADTMASTTLEPLQPERGLTPLPLSPRSPPLAEEVPVLNFEAPSPELKARSDAAEAEHVATDFRTTLQSNDSDSSFVIDDDEDPVSPMLRGAPAFAAADIPALDETPFSPQEETATTVDYGFDESQVFGDSAGHVSASTSGSYGDWTNKDAPEGYDYLSGYNANAVAEDLGATIHPDEPAAPVEDPYGSSYGGYSTSGYEPDPYAADPYAAPPTKSFSSNNYDADPYATPATSTATSSYEPDPYAAAPSQQPSQGYEPDPYAAPSVPSSVPPPRRASAAETVYAPSTYDSGYQPYQPYGGAAEDPYAAAAAPPAQSYQPESYAPAPVAAEDPYAVPTGRDRAYSHDGFGAAPAAYDPYSNIATAAAVGEGTLDLGLERCRAPVVRFGFGGKMLMVFPTAFQSSYNADPYGSSVSHASPTAINIRKLADYVSLPSPSYPGPLFDGVKANAAKKRKEAVAWIDERLAELAQQINFEDASLKASPDEVSRGQKDLSLARLQGREVLIRLIKLLLESDGKLSGSAKIDLAARIALAPETAAAPSLQSFASVSDFSTTFASKPSQTEASYTVTAQNLDTISDHLVRGERPAALKYALDNQMWAHAFIIASSINPESWRDAVKDFLTAELTPKLAGTSNGRESLRVAYGMFAGLGPETMQFFLPPASLSPAAKARSPPHGPTNGVLPDRVGTPVPAAPTAAPVSSEALRNWQSTAAAIVANRSSGDLLALLGLGDTLAKSGWIEAAHACYLLAMPASTSQGFGGPASRMSMIGRPTSGPGSSPTADFESILLTELVEFGLSLAPTPKGTEPFVGFPHLQAYRLYHATVLVDHGQVAAAKKYMDAITTTLRLATKSSAFYHPGFVAQVKLLSERLTASPTQDKAGSWITRKVQRPTLDSVWTTVESRFTKFVAGDTDKPAEESTLKPETPKPTGGPIGPFSHYSSISPATTGGTLSRAQSSVDLLAQHRATPPSRPASAAAPAPAGPPITKRAAYKTHHSRSSSLGFTGYNYDPNAPSPWSAYAATASGTVSPSDGYTPRGGSDGGYASEQQEPERPPPQIQEPATSLAPPMIPSSSAPGSSASGWWGADEASSGVEDNGSLAAPMFTQVGGAAGGLDDDGFISPMMAFSPAPSPAPVSAYGTQGQAHQAASHRRTSTKDEIDDLGFGNAKSKKKPDFDTINEGNDDGDGDATTPTKDNSPSPAAGAAADRPGVRPARSWLGGWFKREPTPQPAGSGPVKATLGEQMSFVFDPELKRWVNKKVGAETAAPAPMAPPPRAQTASPTRAARTPGLAPPMRTMSAAPEGSTSAPPPLPSGGPPRSSLGPPSMSRVASEAGGPPPSPSSGMGMRASLPSSSAAGAAAPPPRPASAGPITDAFAPPPPSTTPVGAAGRRKPLKARYIVQS